MDKSKLFHCLMVDGMYESFVIESLQNGMIMSSPFLSWYTVVLSVLPLTCVRGVSGDSFSGFSIGFWSCSYSVVCLFFISLY
jgi:hypothetical protein